MYCLLERIANMFSQSSKIVSCRIAAWYETPIIALLTKQKQIVTQVISQLLDGCGNHIGLNRVRRN
jgi:hypothetical protein